MKWLHPCLAFALLFAGGFIAFARLFTICLAPDVWPGPGTTWAGVITNRPFGFCQSLAILAKNLFGATPADTVIRSSRATRRRIASAIRVALPAKWLQAETSR